MRSLPMVTGRLYVDQSPLNQRDIDEMSTMIGVVLNAWHGMIQGVDWMGQESKQHAFDKINKVARKVAYPSWIFTDSALNTYYFNLNLTKKEDPLVTANKVARFTAWRDLSTIGEETDRYAWMRSPAEVNAWYAPSFNSITFPAAILMNPMFNGTFPKSYTYSHIGSVMGHELGHGFDASGVFWGPQGQYVPDTWMDADSRAKFNVMAQCVIDEYSKFCFPWLPNNPCINGQKTVTENMADNGGVNAAYRGLMAMLELSGGEPTLPGKLAKYTSEQLFFIGYGNTWCSNEDPATVEYLLQYDVHSPDRYRVNGVVMNMPEFGKAFSCPIGSPMQPKDHCSVWVNPTL